MNSFDRYNCSRKFMIITNMSCNLNCIYCYEKNKNINKSFNVEETIEKLIPILKIKSKNGSLIKFLGGEPFLVFNKIKEFCERIWAENLQEQIVFNATSNGTLIHDEIRNWLIKNKNRFTVKLSLDGNREAHNINRSGSFDQIDLKFFKDTWPDIGIKMTLSPESIIHFADSVIFLHQYGFESVKCNFAEFVDWKSKDYDKIFFNQMMKLINFYIENPKIIPIKLLQVPIRNIFSEIVMHNCTIGERKIIDYTTNKTYPCMFFLPQIAGEEKSNELMKYDLAEVQNQYDQHCNKCEIKKICQTCYAANYIQRGYPSSRDLNICAFQKITFFATSKLLIEKFVKRNLPILNYNHRIEIYNDLKSVKKLWPFLCEIENLYK